MAKKVDKRATALADARSRLAQLQEQHAALAREAMALNARGVELEKAALGVQGEIRALEALSDGGE
jgi:hypothetical protein